MRDNGDKSSFRNRIFNKKNEKVKKNQKEMQDIIDGQFKWLNNMKIQLAEPSIGLKVIIR